MLRPYYCLLDCLLDPACCDLISDPYGHVSIVYTAMRLVILCLSLDLSAERITLALRSHGRSGKTRSSKQMVARPAFVARVLVDPMRLVHVEHAFV